jgi:hypothetical protein
MIAKRVLNAGLRMGRYAAGLRFPMSEEGDHGVKFDEQEIKRKMVEIR